jgi:hypothetical protein
MLSPFKLITLPSIVTILLISAELCFYIHLGRIYPSALAFLSMPVDYFPLQLKGRFTHSMPCPCRGHAVPLPCRAAKGLECVFPIWFTQCSRVWFTLAMPRPCPAPTTPFFSRPRHRTAVERRPVGDRPAFDLFRLPRGVLRRLLSEAYQSQMQVSSVKPNNVCHGRGKEW